MLNIYIEFFFLKWISCPCITRMCAVVSVQGKALPLCLNFESLDSNHFFPSITLNSIFRCTKKN